MRVPRGFRLLAIALSGITLSAAITVACDVFGPVQLAPVPANARGDAAAGDARFSIEVQERESLVAGQTVGVRVRVLRQGYDGEIMLAAEGLPVGVSATATTLGAGARDAVIELAAARETAPGEATVTLDAVAAGTSAQTRFVLVVRGASGSPDTSFGTGGQVSSVAGFPGRLAIQSDDKIVVVATRPGSTGLVVARYLANGVLDPTFGSGGLVVRVGGASDVARGIAIQPDGKIVVGGRIGRDLAVLRYDPNGSLDTTFGGGDGIVTTPVGSADDVVHRLLLQPDGKIVVVGHTAVSAAESHFVVARYASDGSLDTSWGGTGIVTTAISGGNDVGNGGSVQADGKIVAVGLCVFDTPTRSKSCLARYTAVGALDSTFAAGGTLLADLGGTNEKGLSIVAQSDGRLLMSGESNARGTAEATLVRFVSDGGLDPTFGGGIIRMAVQDASMFWDVVPHGGRLVAVGHAVRGASGLDILVARIGQDGALDPTFGDGGTVQGPAGDAYAVAMQSDGRIVVLGRTPLAEDWLLARYWP